MKEKSMVKNSLFYMIYNVLNVLFPFITGVYVARILLPETVGKVAAAQNLVQYFVILAFLGLPTYGIREIAKVRYEKEKLSKLSSELLTINSISTLIFSLCYFILVLVVPTYRESLTLYVVVGISVILNFLNISWLYEGLEEFGFEAIRNLIFKIICFVLLILFVKNDDDYIIYAGITIIGTAGNYILNMLHSKRYVKFCFKDLDLKKHMKSVFYLVAVNLAIEIYTLVDVTMLNIFCEDANVAYYSYGSKIYKILLQVVNTFTMVLVPRIALMYKEKRYEEFNKLLTNTLKIIILISLPMIIGIQFVSKFLICKIYGDAYINSSYILNILSVCLLVSPIGYLLGSRTLLVSSNENKMIIAVGVGAIVNVILNLILIRFYAEFGAAIATVISEFIVSFIYVLLARKIFKLNKFLLNTLKIIISAIFMLLVLIFVKEKVYNEILCCIIQIISSVLIYGVSLLIFQEDLITACFRKYISRKM